MSIDTRMSRARLYVLVDAFEQDMRALVEKYILDHLTEQESLGPDFERADGMRSADAGDAHVSIVHYLFLQQCFDVLSRHRPLLPLDAAEELRSNGGHMGTLVQIRNRVMHGRPLKSDDPELAVSSLQGFQSRHWLETKSTLHRLASDSTWEPAFETLPLPTERVLHNLPHVDYDETGLIGRADDSARLKALVERRREPIITITGEGGIGKTALALDVAYSLVDDSKSPFDCVLWVSLKAEMLTAYGVREITNSIRDITGATRSLGNVLDKTFSGSTRELAEMLGGITALIIIDNLESTRGSEVIGLYDALPDSVTYLFTSRVGIGEVERRYALGPLAPKHASQLFRKFARMRGENRLAALSEKTLGEVLQRLRSSPLAIRWYILSVESGCEPTATLRDQRELLDFCVRNVFESLSAETQATLGVLRALDRTVSFDELAILTEMPIDDLRRAAQEMSRGSLVVNYPDPDGGFVGRIGLSSAARLFLPTQVTAGTTHAEVLQREQDYIRAAELRRLEESKRRLGPNGVRVRGPEDEPTAHLLRIALARSKRGELAQAQEYVERARALNPDFWEVDRVDAFLASTQRHRERAATLYRSALSKTSTPEAEGVVCHYYAGHLARAMHDVDLALPYARTAHQVLQTAETALPLGNLLVWKGQFAEGQELLEEGLDDQDARTRLIARTAIVDSWKRWAERLLEDRLAVEALEKGYAGATVGFEAINQGYLDLKLADSVAEAVWTAVRCASHPGVSLTRAEPRVTTLVKKLALQRELFRNSRHWARLTSALGHWLRESRPSANSRQVVLALFDGAPTSPASLESAPPSRASGRLVGAVISWSGRYGFVEHPDYATNVFFLPSSLARPYSVSELRGASVYFQVEQDDQGRTRASTVELITDVGYSGAGGSS